MTPRRQSADAGVADTGRPGAGLVAGPDDGEPIHAAETSGYTGGMKTAISLPDDVFEAAEREARRSRKSRSQLYAEALSEYLARHSPDEVTETMNRVVDDVGGTSDPFVAEVAGRILQRTEW